MALFRQRFGEIKVVTILALSLCHFFGSEREKEAPDKKEETMEQFRTDRLETAQHYIRGEFFFFFSATVSVSKQD